MRAELLSMGLWAGSHILWAFGALAAGRDRPLGNFLGEVRDRTNLAFLRKHTRIANTMLVLVAPPQTPRKLLAFRLVMNRFGAFLAASMDDMACSICSTSTGSGHLTAQDLSVMAQTFWPELTQDELRDLFQSVCRNRSGYIEMAEFCAALGFDERSTYFGAEALRSLSKLDGALQVLLDRVRISILQNAGCHGWHEFMEFLLADSAGEICRYPWSTDVDERALVLYQAVNARGRSCRLFHGHRELILGNNSQLNYDNPRKPYHWLSTLDAKLGSLIQVVWTGNAQSVRHERAFAAVKSDVDNTVVTWGDTEWGGDSSKVQQRLKKGATQVFGTFGAFEVTSEDTALFACRSKWSIARSKQHFLDRAAKEKFSCILLCVEAEAKAKAKILPAAPALTSSDAVNAQIMAKLAACDATIKDSFGDLVDGEINGGSGHRPYDEKEAASCLGRRQAYICSCPLYWLNLTWDFQPNIPKYPKRLDNLQNHFFETPAHLTEPVLVYLNAGELPHKLKGSLKGFDPPEMRDALRQAVSAAVENALGKKILKAWKEVLMSSIVQKREDLIVKKLNMSVSSLMRIYEIMDFKKQLEATTDKKQNKFALAEYYKQVKLAETSEDVSVAFIEVASMLFTSLLSSNRIQAILFQLDQMAVNPLDSVYKLREVAVQCEKKENLMHWVLSLLADWWFLTDDKDAIPIRSLKESAGGNVSLIKLMLFKKQLRDKLLRMMESEFPAWESSIKGEIRGLVESVEACRAKLGYFDSDDVKKTYEPRGSWPESADLWLLAFETLVYGYEHDEMIRTQLKNRRGVEDILDHGDIKLLGFEMI
eukprot:g1153.t1